MGKWPLGYTAAVGLLRESLRHVPGPALSSRPILQGLLQPVANHVAFPAFTLPQGVSVVAGQGSGLRGEWLVPSGGAIPHRADRMLMWVHGGGFMFCSPGTHRLFLARLVKHSGIPVFCADYRKPPKFPFPTPSEDILDTYKALQDRECADAIFLGGDSAGGNLALHVTRTLCAAGLKSQQSPKGLVLLSPWVDLSDNASESWNSDCDFIPAPQAQLCALNYADGVSLKDPRLSPGRHKSFPLFPPVLLDYGTDEAFCHQIEVLAASMVEDGVDLDALAAEGQVHVYPILEFLWDSWSKDIGPFKAYRKRVAAFLHRC